MKRIKISVLIIIALLLIIIPNISNAAIDPNFAVDKTIGGIYEAMRKNPEAWLNSELPKGEDLLNWGLENSSSEVTDGESTMSSTGALCLGHREQGSDPRKNITQIIDIDESHIKVNETVSKKKINELALAFYIKRAYDNEAKLTATIEKAAIREWVDNNRGNYHYIAEGMGNLQNIKTFPNYEKYIEDAEKYSEVMTKQVLKTNSKSTSQKITQKTDSDGEVYTFVGPYELDFYGKEKLSDDYGGSLTGAVVTRNNGTKIRAIGYSRSININNIKDFDELKSISSDKKFYIVFKRAINTVKNIKLEGEIDFIRARIVISDSKATDGQTIGVYYGGVFEGKKTSVTLPGIPYFDLKVEKIDEDTKKALPNIGFIVFCKEKEGYVKEGNPATYVSNKNNATVFTTNNNGIQTINNLPEIGEYIVYEVSNPHYGYEQVSLNNPIKVGEIDVKSLGGTVTVIAKNKRTFIKISGYVWEDLRTNKTTTPDGTYKSSQDKRLNNVQVILKNSEGKQIGKTLITSGNGNYTFGNYLYTGNANNIDKTRIELDNLTGAYVEFYYNGMCYKSLPVNTGASNGNKASDSKTERANMNNNFATIVNGHSNNQQGKQIHNVSYERNSNATGNYSTVLYINNDENKSAYQFGYEGQIYPISGIAAQYMLHATTRSVDRNEEGKPDDGLLLGQTAYTIDSIKANGIDEIPNINFGIESREMPDMFILQDVDEAEIRFNGSSHIYEYDQRSQEYQDNKNSNRDFNMKVNFGKISQYQSYTRKIYSSDIVYEELNPNTLGVYIKYKIALWNEATGIDSRINGITNYYDARYTIENIQTSNGETIENPRAENIGAYNRVDIPLSEEITSSEKVKYIYITYKVNTDAIISMLNNDMTLDSYTEISSYSSFVGGSSYAGIDIDSEPGNMSINNENTLEDDTSKAPSMTLELENGRAIEGTVFEDDAITELLNKAGYEKERIGNGRYEGTIDNVLENVKVELINNDNTTASLYQYNNMEEQEVKAEYNTDAEGRYILMGVIPGEYHLKYTYKNESVIRNIENGSSNTIGELGGVQYYKSTVYRTQVDNNGNRNTRLPATNYWYASETANTNALRLSDARDTQDIVNSRSTVEEINYSTSSGDTMDGLTEINATSEHITIEIDYDESDLNTITPQNTTTGYNEAIIINYNQIDFGIIRRPKQELVLSKEISRIELTLANGQVLISGDPRDQNIRYVQKLDNSNLHLEVDQELLQGATLTVEYEVKVNNENCEIDYNNNNYYYYGIIPANHEGWKIATIKDLYEYPRGLTIDTEVNENAGWEILMTSDLTNGEQVSEDVYKALQEYGAILHTNEFENMQPGEEKIVTVSFSKLLSIGAEDLTINNDIEINKYLYRKNDNTTPGNYVPSSGPYESDDAATEIIITGPTGENQNYLPYILIGISGLLILAVGIIFIKKKSVKK